MPDQPVSTSISSFNPYGSEIHIAQLKAFIAEHRPAQFVPSKAKISFLRTIASDIISSAIGSKPQETPNATTSFIATTGTKTEALASPKSEPQDSQLPAASKRSRTVSRDVPETRPPKKQEVAQNSVPDHCKPVIDQTISSDSDLTDLDTATPPPVSNASAQGVHQPKAASSTVRSTKKSTKTGGPSSSAKQQKAQLVRPPKKTGTSTTNAAPTRAAVAPVHTVDTKPLESINRFSAPITFEQLDGTLVRKQRDRLTGRLVEVPVRRALVQRNPPAKSPLAHRDKAAARQPQAAGSASAISESNASAMSPAMQQLIGLDWSPDLIDLNVHRPPLPRLSDPPLVEDLKPRLTDQLLQPDGTAASSPSVTMPAPRPMAFPALNDGPPPIPPRPRTSTSRIAANPNAYPFSPRQNDLNHFHHPNPALSRAANEVAGSEQTAVELQRNHAPISSRFPAQSSDSISEAPLNLVSDCVKPSKYEMTPRPLKRRPGDSSPSPSRCIRAKGLDESAVGTATSPQAKDTPTQPQLNFLAEDSKPLLINQLLQPDGTAASLPTATMPTPRPMAFPALNDGSPPIPPRPRTSTSRIAANPTAYPFSPCQNDLKNLVSDCVKPSKYEMTPRPLKRRPSDSSPSPSRCIRAKGLDESAVGTATSPQAKDTPTQPQLNLSDLLTDSKPALDPCEKAGNPPHVASTSISKCPFEDIVHDLIRSMRKPLPVQTRGIPSSAQPHRKIPQTQSHQLEGVFAAHAITAEPSPSQPTPLKTQPSNRQVLLDQLENIVLRLATPRFQLERVALSADSTSVDPSNFTTTFQPPCLIRHLSPVFGQPSALGFGSIAPHTTVSVSCPSAFQAQPECPSPANSGERTVCIPSMATVDSAPLSKPPEATHFLHMCDRLPGVRVQSPSLCSGALSSVDLASTPTRGLRNHSEPAAILHVVEAPALVNHAPFLSDGTTPIPLSPPARPTSALAGPVTVSAHSTTPIPLTPPTRPTSAPAGVLPVPSHSSAVEVDSASITDHPESCPSTPAQAQDVNLTPVTKDSCDSSLTTQSPGDPNKPPAIISGLGDQILPCKPLRLELIMEDEPPCLPGDNDLEICEGIAQAIDDETFGIISDLGDQNQASKPCLPGDNDQEICQGHAQAIDDKTLA